VINTVLPAIFIDIALVVLPAPPNKINTRYRLCHGPPSCRRHQNGVQIARIQSRGLRSRDAAPRVKLITFCYRSQSAMTVHRNLIALERP
jgi:hypothetical protein